MPITVSCPACAAVHTAPDLAAGRTLNCRMCRAPIAIPAAEVEEEPVEFDPVEEDPVEVETIEEPAAADGAKPAAPADRPKAKGKKKKKAKPAKRRMSPVVKWGLVGAGAFVLLVVVLVGGYYATRAAAGPPPDKEMAGVGWYKSEDTDNWLTVYFPGAKPKYERHGFRIPEGMAKLANSTSEELSWSMQTWERKDGGREYGVFLFTLPSKGSSPKEAEQAVARTSVAPGPDVEVLVDDTITVSGYTARRKAIRTGKGSKVSLMIGIGSHRLVGVTVEGGGTFDHTDPKVAAFIENLTLRR